MLKPSGENQQRGTRIRGWRYGGSGGRAEEGRGLRSLEEAGWVFVRFCFCFYLATPAAHRRFRARDGTGATAATRAAAVTTPDPEPTVPRENCGRAVSVVVQGGRQAVLLRKEPACIRQPFTLTAGLEQVEEVGPGVREESGGPGGPPALPRSCPGVQVLPKSELRAPALTLVCAAQSARGQRRTSGSPRLLLQVSGRTSRPLTQQTLTP